MPLYEYHCRPCKRRFEQLRPMEFSDRDAPCPSCGKPAGKVLSVFAAFRKDASSGESSALPAAGGGCGGGDSCCGGSCGA